MGDAFSVPFILSWSYLSRLKHLDMNAIVFHIVWSIFAEVFLTLILWKKYSASIPCARMAKNAVVKQNSMSWAESKEAGPKVGPEAGQDGNLVCVDWLNDVAR